MDITYYYTGNELKCTMGKTTTMENSHDKYYNLYITGVEFKLDDNTSAQMSANHQCVLDFDQGFNGDINKEGERIIVAGIKYDDLQRRFKFDINKYYVDSISAFCRDIVVQQNMILGSLGYTNTDGKYVKYDNIKSVRLGFKFEKKEFACNIL